MALDPFHNRPDELRLYSPLHGTTMLELGNKRNGDAIYKAWFESLGFRHVSVDWNGKDGALDRDLRVPLWPEFGQFDMVTNIGTTEHVSEQRGVWENIHNLTAPGGVLCSLTPYPDGLNWWWHGEWYPTEGFFQSFAALNGWELERLYKDREPPFCNLYARLKKTEDKPFTMPDLSLIKRNKMTPRNRTPVL